MDVLVAGATGRLGGPLADRLLDRGHRVRALTRDPGSAAADRLRQSGAHIVAGDLDDPSGLHRFPRRYPGTAHRLPGHRLAVPGAVDGRTRVARSRGAAKLRARAQHELKLGP